MNLTEIFSILIIHWIADFILQTDKQAKNKSSSWKYLTSHTFWYTFTWFIIGIFYIIINQINPWFLFLFCIITFVLHTITDYFTSRLNKKLWENNKVHDFFVSVGFDQILHYIQLFLIYYYITKL